MGGAARSVGKIAKGDVGGFADLGLQSISGGQLSTKGFDGELGNMLMGKKAPGVKSGFTQLNPLQIKALGRYNKQMDENTDQLAENAVASQEKQVRANAEDAQRNAGKLVAQRGLGNSSVGLNAIVNTQRKLGDQIGAVRAQLPGMKYDMKLNNLNAASGGINSILNTRGFIQGTPQGPRQGGLLPLIGAGVGGYFGGAAGAGVGMGLGNYMTQMGG